MAKSAAYYRWKLRYYARKRVFATGLPKRLWTSQEVRELFLFEGTDTQLAMKIRRSVEAIQVKRAKTPEPTTY